MADYIYLLQNRLTPAQWRALEAVREAARAHGMPVFLVGGAVRDLTTGSPVRDLDFAVQGDVNALIPDLQGTGAAVTGHDNALSSVYLSFPGGVRGEVGPSLSVAYPTPGQPVTHPAPILDDLRHRDFTANAMAVSLNEGSYGLLLDPLNGTADIENRELRLVSAYGFIEQPALLLRAARLSERLGWTMEERTAARYQTSKEEGHIQAMPAADRGYEIEEIFHEEDPRSTLEHMESEGWRDLLFAPLDAADIDSSGLDSVRDLIGQLEGQGIHPDASAVYFPLLTGKLSEKDRATLKEMFVRRGFVQQIETVETRSKELAAQLTSRAAAQPSDSWRLLKGADPELVLWLAFHVRSGAVQAKIKAFLKDWPQMRQKIPYALMQEMRITPELPEYDKLLDDLFFALIDGKLDTPEATKAFLEPFSPPAPPQISVRRRPAKASRSRAKRLVEQLPAEDSEAAEGPDEEDTPLPGEPDVSNEEREPTAEATAEEPSRDVSAALVKGSSHTGAIVAGPAQPKAAVKAPVAEKTAAVKTAPVKAVVAARSPAPAKGAAFPVKAPAAAKGKTGENATTLPEPARKSSQKVAPAKAAPAKSTHGKAAGTIKTPTKHAAAKSSSKGGNKAALKRSAGADAKSAKSAKAAHPKTTAKKHAKPAPKKTTLGASSKGTPAKAPAKKQAAHGGISSSQKRPAPAKAFKKAGMKKRSGR